LGAAHVVVDEAHCFPDAATSALSLQIESERLEQLLSLPEGPAAEALEEGGAASGKLAGVSSRPGKTGTGGKRQRASGPLKRLQAKLQEARKTLRDLDAILAGPPRRATLSRQAAAGKADRPAAPGSVRFGAQFARASEAEKALEELAEKLGGVAGIAYTLAARGTAPISREALQGLGNEIVAQRDALANFLKEEEGYVRLVTPLAAGRWRLEKILLFPSDALPDYFLRHYASVTLVSASMSVGHEVSFIADQIGARGDREHRWHSLSLPSPFDYANRVLLGVPAEAAFRYRWDSRGEFYEAVTEALAFLLPRLAPAGGVLVLFTNREEMERIYQRLQREAACASLRLLCQAEGTRSEVESAFRAVPGSVLLGLRSYLSGVDFPGETLVSVILVKLPFRSPSDPVEEARAAELSARGVHPFAGYALPTAVLDFKQCFGRLIRSASDYGVVIVLDTRIDDFPAFLASIPKCRLLRAPYRVVAEEAEAFLSSHRRSPGPG